MFITAFTRACNGSFSQAKEICLHPPGADPGLVGPEIYATDGALFKQKNTDL